MSARRTDYVTHPACALHDMGDGHPEQPARLVAIERQLAADGLLDRLQRQTAGPASDAQLARAHTPEMLDGLARMAPRAAGQQRAVCPDTVMTHLSLGAARHAAGAVVAAVDRVLGGAADAAFCNVRPPGHHAERGRAMGFCFYNNIAIGALHALEAHGLQRVAIIDFDVHYGNGTADIVADDPRILLCSLYQYPLYPLLYPAGSAAGQSNLMLRRGDSSAEFRHGVSQTWVAALEAHAPELVLFSAGFDAHTEDPLAELNLTDDDFAWVTRKVLQVTATSAQHRAVSALEGGYDLAALGRAASAHVASLMAPEP